MFLTAVLAGYSALPVRRRARADSAAPEPDRAVSLRQSAFLLAASLFFYACAGVAYLPLLLAAALLAYGAGRMLARMEKPSARKAVLTAALVLLIGNLCFFKYYAQLAALLPLPENAPAMPLGVSFYTFALSGYLIDQYRRRYPPEKNLILFVLFAFFFPVISSGPIERGNGLLPQLKKPHAFDYEVFCQGASRILWGFFKKFVVADTIAIAVDRVFGDLTGFPGPYLCLAVLLYSYQLYCDFSGYSDIAIGTARLFGFSVRENFRRPFAARTFSELWRRWHISLTGWFREYLYFPLGGSRRGAVRTYLNILIIFLVSGIWHGSGMTFAVWGLLNGAYMAFGRATKAFRARMAQKNPLLQNRFFGAAVRIGTVYLLFSSCIVFFRAPDMASAGYLYTHFLSGWSGLLHPGLVIDTLRRMGIGRVTGLLILFSVGLTEWVEWRAEQNGLRTEEWMRTLGGKRRMALYYVLLLLIMTFGALGRSSFIYFAF